MTRFRRQFIVHPRLQYLLLIISLVFLLIGASAALNVLKLLSSTEGLPFNYYIGEIIIPVSVITILIFIAMVAANILVTNRIAGPVYRLKKHMDSLVKGENLGPVKLRDDDYFTELADSYNEVLKLIEKQK